LDKEHAIKTITRNTNRFGGNKVECDYGARQRRCAGSEKTKELPQ
jgi:hypothetical protein